jgi:dihydropteroate synthase
MGIVNVTPDSFSDGGALSDVDMTLRHIERLIGEGADCIDIGAESTRPGFQPVESGEEMRRLEPILKVYKTHFSAPLSLDTMKADVAEMGLAYGVDLINDVSGLMHDDRMPEVIARAGAGVIVMHRSQGAEYDDVIAEIRDFLVQAVDKAKRAGIEFVCVDPGIGFGKTLNHNVTILNHLELFRIEGCPIVVGTSRKSFIGLITGDAVSDRLEGTLSSVVASLFRGANMVRVHDVGQVKKAVLVADRILRAGYD